MQFSIVRERLWLSLKKVLPWWLGKKNLSWLCDHAFTLWDSSILLVTISLAIQARTTRPLYPQFVLSKPSQPIISFCLLSSPAREDRNYFSHFPDRKRSPSLYGRKWKLNLDVPAHFFLSFSLCAFVIDTCPHFSLPQPIKTYWGVKKWPFSECAL